MKIREGMLEGFIKAHDTALDKYDFDKFVGGTLPDLEQEMTW